MSFYRDRSRASRYMDVHETPAVAGPARRPDASDAAEWVSRRRNRPVEHLLPIAERWSATLPAAVRPTTLMALYPRVANLIALQWSDSTARVAYFDELLVDRRGNRQGFPSPVMTELLRLRDFSYAPDPA